MRDVVVLPLVPVMLAMGMVLGALGGNSMSIMGPATSLGVPSLGARCIRRPGHAFTSHMAPPVSRYDAAISVVMKSTPPTSRPMALMAWTAISRLSGCTLSVTSIAGPPVERLAVAHK